MSGLETVGYGAGVVLILSWLFISFKAAGPGRAVVEWVAATSMYLLLCSIFVHMLVRALQSGNNVALVAFGFLCALFGSGLAVSVTRTCMAMGGGTREQVSATN